MKQKADMRLIIAKAGKDIKILFPIIFGIACGILIFCIIILKDANLLFVQIPVLLLLAAMAVMCLLSPKNAIVYDKEKQEFLIRAGFNMFSAFKTRRVLLEDVKEAYAYGLFKSLYIVTNNKTVLVTSISKPMQAAERINAIKAETKTENI